MREISCLLQNASEQFEQASKSVESILDAARLKFEKGFSTATAGVGAVLALGSQFLAVFGRSTAVATVGVVSEITLILAALWIRHWAGNSQAEAWDAKSISRRDDCTS